MPCYDCGMDYEGEDWIEAVIPDKIWNKISPTKEIGNPQGGLLCITCIVRRLNRLGIKNVSIWLRGIEPIIAMEGDPEENIDILRNWDVT